MYKIRCYLSRASSRQKLQEYFDRNCHHVEMSGDQDLEIEGETLSTVQVAYDLPQYTSYMGRMFFLCLPWKCPDIIHCHHATANMPFDLEGVQQWILLPLASRVYIRSMEYYASLTFGPDVPICEGYWRIDT